MDFGTIATFIALQIASGFLKENGKDIYEKVKSVLTSDELISLNLLEAHSDDKALQSEVAIAVQRHLETNPDIVRELETLIANLPIPEIKQNAITQAGGGNIAVQDVHGSNIHIKK
jgi:hypothetical protein